MNDGVMLQVTDVVKHFRQSGWWRSSDPVQAVNGVSLDISRGETLGLVGESGCGKSTLGRTIIRLEQPDSGTVVLEGTDITALAGEELRRFRSKMQMVFQDPYGSLNPRMRVGDAVSEGLLVHSVVPRGEVADRTATLLEEVGLDRGAVRKYPHQFSGGQRQRIGIARALAVEPSLVVCDEPVSALDVSVQAQILNLFRDIQERRRLSYLFIAHDLAVVRQLAHRVAVMYLGRIIEQGPSAVVLDTPSHPYTQALVSAVPVPDPSVKTKRIILPGEVPSPIDPPSGCPFHPRCFHPSKDRRCLSQRPALVPLGGVSVACHYATAPPKPAEHATAPPGES